MFWQDSDWEEVGAGDADVDQDLLHVATAKSSGKPAYDHLAAMAKVFEVFSLPFLSRSPWFIVFLPFLFFFALLFSRKWFLFLVLHLQLTFFADTWC